jgi:hypothetical protein
MFTNNPLYSKSLKDTRIKELNNIIENKLSYNEQKNLLIYIIRTLNTNMVLDVVKVNDDYKVLFQLKLFELDNKNIKKLDEYVKKMLKRNINFQKPL